MKKTLTVNLGGTVFHIDEDAYNLLDKYLYSLANYFKKEEGGEEIIKDIEMRISELFAERVSLGYQVITLDNVEEVINRIGKPEEFIENDKEENPSSENTKEDQSRYQEFEYTQKKLYRDPDNKILGGVAAGFAAYMGWDVTVLRLVLLLILIFTKFSIGILYLIGWLLIPEAKTITEKLAMHGKKVTMENIGKTVTDNFQKFSMDVNMQFNKAKQRGTFERIGDQFVQVIGVIMKIFLTILAIIFSPVLLVVAIVFFVVIIVALSLAIGGGSMLYTYLPSADWSVFINSPVEMITMSVAGILLVGIPLIGIIYTMLGPIFKWKPMGEGIKITLIVLWVISLIIGIILYGHTGTLPGIYPISYY